MHTTPKILLIEDQPDLAELFKLQLAGRGYKADWFVGAESLDSPMVLLTDSGQKVELDLADYEVALVDGDLGKAINGWDITARLATDGLPVIGISNDEGYNNKIKKAGAREVYPKYSVMSHVRSGQLQLTRHISAPRNST